MRFGLKGRLGRNRSGSRNDRLKHRLGDRSIVLIGLMGAGKTSIGRQLAKRLRLGFVDADHEIEAAAGMSISDIFAHHGEGHFRDGERKVIKRLLNDGPQVLATGGGAYMNDETRKAIKERGVTLWLKADLDVLMERVSRKNTRPLLQTADPRAVMQKLLDERYPVYQLAETFVMSRNAPQKQIVEEAVEALAAYLIQEARRNRGGDKDNKGNQNNRARHGGDSKKKRT